MKFLLDVAISDMVDSVLIDPCCPRVRVDEIICRAKNVDFTGDIRKSNLFEWPRSSKQPMVNEQVKGEASCVSSGKPIKECIGTTDVPEVRFWRMFQRPYRNGKSEFGSRCPPDRRYWTFPIGNGMSYAVVYNRQFARAELYIDSPDAQWNQRVCQDIEMNLKARGEDALFKFDPLENRRASRISYANNVLRFTDESQWSQAVEWLCGALDALRAKTESYVKNIN